MTEHPPNDRNPWHLIWLRVAGMIGTLFGLLTLREGGAVLFIDGPARVAAGDFVPFVLWFNFIAGFAYVAAGIGLLFRKTWAVRLAAVIALATLAVFAGGAYETRTVVAITLRSTVWCAIAALSWGLLLRSPRSPVTDVEAR